MFFSCRKIKLHCTLAIPPAIAISQLGRHALLYLITSKTVITLELTCPSAEKVESWHAIKFGKHDLLFSAIKTKGWFVSLLWKYKLKDTALPP